MQTALLIFIVIFATAIGFFLGLFLLSLDSPLLKKLFQKEEPAHDGALPETDEISNSGEGQPQVKKPSPDAKLILRVWKDADKPPVYDIDGKYLAKEKLPRDILNVITISEEIPLQSESVIEPVINEKPVVIEPKPEEGELEPEPEIKMLSVVDEVNEILQRKLLGSPLAGKGIHLMENHNKEIRFWVGLNSYNDVEEIPDSEVRQIIDESVREWEENRQ